MSRVIYDKVVEMLKQNEEVELYRFVFTESGKLDFYTDKVYTAEDGDKITRSVVLASGFGATYIDVDEIYELPPDINIFTFIHTRFNVVGSITVERI